MPTKKPAAAPQIHIKEWISTADVDKAAAKLRRRVSEAEQLNVREAILNRTGAEDILLNDVRTSILEVFGENSPEHRQYGSIGIWSGPVRMGMSREEVVEANERGRTHIVSVLNGLVARLLEKREEISDSGQPSRQEVTRVLNLHPRIADVAEDLYEDGYHWEAVFAASKSLVNYVKERSGQHQLDGTGLMRTVFSRNNPLLAFNDLQDQTDFDEQEGMMHLFEGAVLAIRNPGGHSFPEGSEQRATEYLALLSLLAYRTQEAKRRKPN